MQERLATGYEPRFDIDAEYGRQGELFVSSIIDSLRSGSIEVKRDSRFAQTGNIYIEYECKSRSGEWRKSGIATSQAELWAFVLGDSSTVVFIPTASLKELALSFWRNPKYRREETDGDCPSKGIIIPVVSLIEWAKKNA